MKESLLQKLTGARTLLGAIIVLQLITLFLAINPISLVSGLSSVQVINEVSSIVPVPPGEVPVLAVIGDGQIPDIEELKKENEFNALVYANAQNGDYVLGYSTKMVIYRRPTRQVIYEGETPVTRYNNAATDLGKEISDVAKAQGILAADSDETPQLVAINDLASAQSQSPSFYANAAIGDVVATYNDAGVIVLYRREGKQILNHGTFTTDIQ
jgi:hypothetical protein